MARTHCPAITAHRLLLLPAATAANASAAWRKSVIVPHDQLRLDLIDRIHGHANHNQQRRSPKIKGDTQAVQHPVGQTLKEWSKWTEQVVQVDTDHQPFRYEGDDDQV